MPASARVDVVVVLQSSMLIGNSRQIAESALAKRLLTVYGYRDRDRDRDHVIAGGLASYGVDLRWCFHRTPQRLKALDIAVPQSLLARADEVFEQVRQPRAGAIQPAECVLRDRWRRGGAN